MKKLTRLIALAVFLAVTAMTVSPAWAAPTIPPAVGAATENPYAKDPADTAAANPTATPGAATAAKYPTGKILFLTIDDGPGPYTHAILNILDRYNVKATFFMQGEYYKEYASAIRRIVASGHGFGLHSMTHSEKKFYASPESMIGELKQCQNLMDALAFTSSRLVRVPYGSDPYFTEGKKKYKPGEQEAMNANGYRFWDWNIDSEDWKYTSDQGAAVGASIISMLKNHDPSRPAILLIHEHAFVKEYLPGVIEYALSAGYTFMPITDVCTPMNYQGDET